MPKTTTKKIGLAIDAGLYADLSKLAEENGQSRRFLLEKALEHLLSAEKLLSSAGAKNPGS